ncbi:TetR family transcriptional regulator [Fulvivirgaceae bacterium BMA10]|uniref:Biofilm operon icaADBC HTH-type negative transcriptional regulator IcaR n=1 Tax=Splendidivirga corallicola TaxID=3051826 RepID=A0ABT8KYB9_9BACT|nr:TetR family transcriptional regulator [Fulvivirgaceae bacterium BMA10]
MGRKSLKDARRKEIIRAFYKVAKKEGLENASLAKVARLMDIHPSLIIHYFRSKEDLIFGLIEYILERYKLIYKAENSTLDTKERLVKIVGNLFSRKWNTLFDDGVFYSCYALIFRDKKVQAHYKTLHDSLRELFSSTLKEAKQEGLVNVQDVEATSDLIFIMVEGAYYYLGLINDKNEYQGKLKQYEQEALRLLGLN